jgi:hypothetical protein
LVKNNLSAPLSNGNAAAQKMRDDGKHWGNRCLQSGIASVELCQSAILSQQKCHLAQFGMAWFAFPAGPSCPRLPGARSNAPRSVNRVKKRLNFLIAFMGGANTIPDCF